MAGKSRQELEHLAKACLQSGIQRKECMLCCLLACGQLDFSYTFQNPLTKEWCCLQWAVVSHVDQPN